MANYALEGQKWGAGPFGSGGGTVTWAIDSSVPAYFVAELTAAFDRWASCANITFSRVDATASSAIDFGLGYIDGRNNILGTAGYSYAGSSFKAATVTFDSAEGWHVSGDAVVSSGGTDLFVVALHEIGHAIGLDHYNATPAVMNSVISPAVTDLTQSEVDGIRAIYGQNASSVFGTTVHSVHTIGGEVFAFYDALLDRRADRIGLEVYADSRSSGLSLHDLAQIFLDSPERSASLGRYDQLGNHDFVEQLYETVLDRKGDAGGLAAYENALAGGTSRADVAVTFALSDEHIAALRGPLSAGVFVPDRDAADVARLYYGLQDRAPDASGLAAWAGVVRQGTSLLDVAQRFIDSSEYHSKFGGLDDSHFVQALYAGALGRDADPGGLQAYVDHLQHGVSRAEAAVVISESGEAQQHHLAGIETGWTLA